MPVNGRERPVMPGAWQAMTVIHPGSAGLRVRYRQGVLIDAAGFPDWVLYARTVVELPAPIAELTGDEHRVFDVLAANRVMLGADPLWPDLRVGLPHATATPPGWCWARLPVSGERARRVALVPVELHGAFRHGGGSRTLPVGRPGSGVRTGVAPVERGNGEVVSEPIIAEVEALLGYGLPPAYRRFLAAGNGVGPAEPAVSAVAGMVVDQPLFGLGRDDMLQDLGYAPRWLGDRFTGEFLPVGFVQGGILAIRVAGPDAGSVWFFDDDDPRDDDSLGPAEICGRLLRRCAGDFDEFWAGLRRPAAVLLEVVEDLVAGGLVREVRPELAGAALPERMRAEWQAVPQQRSISVDDLML